MPVPRAAALGGQLCLKTALIKVLLISCRTMFPPGIGFSDDAKMGRDDVVAVVGHEGTFQALALYNSHGMLSDDRGVSHETDVEKNSPKNKTSYN